MTLPLIELVKHYDRPGPRYTGYPMPPVWQEHFPQEGAVEALAKANPRTVYVNISGNAVAMPWKDRVPAIVQGWFIGSEAGTSLAAVLTGDVNPSGKLPFTWPSATTYRASPGSSRKTITAPFG